MSGAHLGRLQPQALTSIATKAGAGGFTAKKTSFFTYLSDVWTGKAKSPTQGTVGRWPFLLWKLCSLVPATLYVDFKSLGSAYTPVEGGPHHTEPEGGKILL